MLCENWEEDEGQMETPPHQGQQQPRDSPFHKRDRKTMSMVGGGRATSMASLTAPRTHVLSCAQGSGGTGMEKPLTMSCHVPRCPLGEVTQGLR